MPICTTYIRSKDQTKKESEVSRGSAAFALLAPFLVLFVYSKSFRVLRVDVFDSCARIVTITSESLDPQGTKTQR